MSDADTRKARKGKHGPYGMDWYKYYDGVPPEDDDDDYEWSGFQWCKVWDEDNG